jgi:phosphoribosylformimino-5-aminoimidazole carboxamide ribotide isomerase
MLIIPAIDLKDGKCVRLYQGDYDQMTIFSDDPVAMAQSFREAGAKYIHVVDLDGAKTGKPTNRAVIAAIVREGGLPMETSGGVRSEESVAELLNIGVDRVIIGTIAVKEPDLAERICQKWGERIIIGIDARNGLVAVEGWTETSGVLATDLAKEFTRRGAQRYIYTDINRDGTLTEPNYAAFSEFQAAAARPVIASGGVSRVEHVTRLREIGAEGVIIGRAIYTGDLKLADLI